MITCESINQQMGALYCCSQVKDFIRIRTPFLYPDGDYIDLFLKTEDDVQSVTDLGETVRWLRMQTLSEKRTKKQRQLIADICLTHNVEFFKGMLMVRSRAGEEASALMRLAQAVLRVSDLWFTFRYRSIETVKDEVEGFLQEKGINYERSEKLQGRSGRIWTPDFHTRTSRRSSLIMVLSTGSKAAGRVATEHVVAAWHDLNYLVSGQEALQFISLFDDTMDVWTPEDFGLVESISELAYWSKPDELIDRIAA